MSVHRERSIIQAFVSLADSLADGSDMMGLMSGLVADCALLLDITYAGLLLADGEGVLRLVAASSEATRDLDLFRLQREQSPWLDCYRSGEPVHAADLEGEAQRWPQLVTAARRTGIASVHVFPVRLQGDVLGTLGLFGGRVGPLPDEDLRLAQALAHVACIAIVQGKIIADATTVAEQLQQALNSRVVIEQAKGVVAQRGDLGMDEAFIVLCRYARDRNQRLAAVAQAVTSRALPAQHLLTYAQTKHGRSERSDSR